MKNPYGTPSREIIYTMEISEGEGREKGVESLFKEIMAYIICRYI